LSSFSRNVSANLLATGWTALVLLAVVPVLISLAGVASFAVVSFYTVLVGTLAILDFGLSPTLTRRMAGVKVGGADPARAAHSLRTYELVYGGMGLIVGGLIAASADRIASTWLSSSVLAENDIRHCVLLMGLLVFLRWPMAPYVATLQGLQKQVGLSAVNAAAATVANGGGVAVLALLAPDIELFFAWQCACALAQLLVLRALAWRALPAPGGARFMGGTLLDSWRFASGMTGISVTSAILTQGDKLVLSKLVPLEEFGYYAVAITVSAGLYVIIMPIFTAALPRLCEHVAAGDEKALREAFASSSSLMNALLVPVSLFLVLFAHELLALWTRNPEIAYRSAPLLALLGIGTLLNGFMNIPFALQLARGNSRLSFTICVMLCVLLVPAMLVLTGRFGIVGGAAVSPILNGLSLLIGLPLTYRKCLGSSHWTSFYSSLMRQQGPAFLLLVAIRWIVPLSANPVLQGLELAAAFAASLALSVALTPRAREILADLVRARRNEINA
jgi:O-antigen/teichoic acid export membrane protein